MGGKAEGGRRCSYQEGWELGARVLAQLQDAGAISCGMIAGSLRRKKAEVGDVDLVVIPSEPVFNEVVGALHGWQVAKKKDDPLKAKRSGLWDGIQVDLFTTTMDGYGACQMFATGSWQLNVVQRMKAKRLGLLLNEKGLWRGTQLVAGKTERDVYDVLGLAWLEAEERSL